MRDGEKKSLDLTTPRSFVIGRCPDGDEGSDGEGDTSAPCLETIHEGMNLEIDVVARKPNGVTLDITVEQTTVTAVDRRTDAANHELQIPLAETRRKRVIEFVEFDHVLHISLAGKSTAPRAPAVELFVGSGDTIRFNMPIPAEFREEANNEQQNIFNALSQNGAKIYGQRVSLWQAWRGQSLWDDLGLETVLEFAELAQLWQQLSGSVTWLSALSPIIADEMSSHQIEEALIGATTVFTVQLSESPTLLQDIALVGRVPTVYAVRIFTDNTTDELLAAVRKLRLPRVEILELAEYQIAMRTNGREIAYVTAYDAERAIPQLEGMKAPNTC